VNWADLMVAQGAFGTDFYDRSTRTMVGTMLWTEYRPVIKIGPKGALGSHEIRPIQSAPSLAPSIPTLSAIFYHSITLEDFNAKSRNLPSVLANNFLSTCTNRLYELTGTCGMGK